MQNQQQNMIRCSSCGHAYNIPVYSILDVATTPQFKSLLLSGRLNSASCPNCGNINSVVLPLLYHDAEKELLIALVPMDLNLNKDDQERLIGNMMNKLPKGNFKGYMFNPRRAITLQGMINQVLEADGITPEMMEEQRARIQLVQNCLEAGSEEALQAIVKDSDAQMDDRFFQAFSLIAQRALEDGQPQIAQQMLAIQNRVVELSTYGKQLIAKQAMQEKIIEEVANKLETYGDDMNRQDILALAISYADQEDHIQALVGMIRPAFDDELFQMLTVQIAKAPSQDREKLEKLRDKLTQLTATLDQQNQRALQGVVGFLQTLVNHPQPEELIAANIESIDDTFMAVLSANIQQADQAQNTALSERLKYIYNMVVSILRANMSPELRFINTILGTENDTDAQKMIQEEAPQLGGSLIEAFHVVEQMLAEQGNASLVGRVQTLRSMTEKVLNI
ncbi:MAG: CpXC domain-containing protein [Phototrophicales bacterium]|nr:CpXC domain-containing protein [Phototrophicales bacterium]